MFKKKVIFIISIISILGVVFTFFIMNAGATTEQSHSLQIKKQLEQQMDDELKEKAVIAAKARSSIKVAEEKHLPALEPEEYKKPYQWKPEGFMQRHDLRVADTVWTAYGVIEPNGEVWDEFVVWSGHYDNQLVIGTLLTPDGYDGKYNATYVCPQQDIGKIYITNIKGSDVYFKAESGRIGTFNLDSHNWNFTK